MRRRGAGGKPTPPPDQEGRVMENDGTDSPGVSRREFLERLAAGGAGLAVAGGLARPGAPAWAAKGSVTLADVRSEEHTSELQSHHDLVCRLLLEKKKSKRRR